MYIVKKEQNIYIGKRQTDQKYKTSQRSLRFFLCGLCVKMGSKFCIQLL